MHADRLRAADLSIDHNILVSLGVLTIGIEIHGRTAQFDVLAVVGSLFQQHVFAQEHDFLGIPARQSPLTDVAVRRADHPGRFSRAVQFQGRCYQPGQLIGFEMPNLSRDELVLPRTVILILGNRCIFHVQIRFICEFRRQRIDHLRAGFRFKQHIGTDDDGQRRGDPPQPALATPTLTRIHTS